MRESQDLYEHQSKWLHQAISEWFYRTILDNFDNRLYSTLTLPLQKIIFYSSSVEISFETESKLTRVSMCDCDYSAFYIMIILYGPSLRLRWRGRDPRDTDFWSSSLSCWIKTIFGRTEAIGAGINNEFTTIYANYGTTAARVGRWPRQIYRGRWECCWGTSPNCEVIGCVVRVWIAFRPSRFCVDIFGLCTSRTRRCTSHESTQWWKVVEASRGMSFCTSK